MRSVVTTSAQLAVLLATSCAAICSARALVAQACCTVGPVTFSRPIMAVTQGSP